MRKNLRQLARELEQLRERGIPLCTPRVITNEAREAFIATGVARGLSAKDAAEALDILDTQSRPLGETFKLMEEYSARSVKHDAAMLAATVWFSLAVDMFCEDVKTSGENV